MEDSISYNVHQGVDVAEKSILLQRSQSRVKQVEFELAVSKEVSTSLTTQLQEAKGKVKELQGQLDGSGKLKLGEAGLNQLLTISQAKLKKQQADGSLHGEQVLALASELKQSRKRLRELELERSIHLSKIDECLNMLEAQSSPEEHNLQKKLLKTTGLSHRVEYMQDQLDEKDNEIKELKEEGKINTAMVKELTKVLRPELDARQIRDTIDCLQGGRELSPEQAQLLTTQHLKSRVESLEDEKSILFDRITDLTKQVEETFMAKSTRNTTATTNLGLASLKGKVDLSALKSMVNSGFRKK